MSVAQAGGVMVSAVLFSRLLGLLREAFISVRFGLNELTDAYRAAFVIPDLLFFLVAGGALSSAFIPVFTRYWTEGKEDEAWKVFSAVCTIMGAAVILLILLAEWWAPALVSLATPGLPESTQPLAVAMARILLPAQFGFFMGGLMFGTMNARGHFVTPALSPNIYNVGIIVGGAALAPILAVPIFGLAWGALVGAVVGNLLIPIWMMRRFGVNFRPVLDFRHEGVAKVFRLMLPVVLGLSLPGVYAIVIKGFGSLHGEGAISALEIGNRIMQAPLGVFGQALAIAVFPTLVALFVKGQASQFLAILSKTLRTSLFLGIFVSAVLFVLSEDVVRVMNQYGKFGASDTQVVAGSLKMYSLGIFAWCAHPILMRAFFAMEDTLMPVILGTVTTGVFFLLCVVLGGGPLGYQGLALAVSVSAVVLMVLLLAGLRRKLSRVDGARILRMTVLAGLAAVATAAAVAFAARLVPTPDGLAANAVSLGRIFVLGLGGAWLYLAIGKLLGLEEADYALAAILRRRRPPPNDTAAR